MKVENCWTCVEGLVVLGPLHLRIPSKAVRIKLIFCIVRT